MKRLFDLSVALAVTVFLALPILIVALAVWMTSPGPALYPDFDTAKSHAPREAAQRKASREALKAGVYLGQGGAQSRFRIGFGGLIFNAFNRLAAPGDGSVTCQTRPLGLDNSAS